MFDEEDDPCRSVAVLGYNTESQVQKSTIESSNEQEARWNYAFWLQNEMMCLGRGDTAEDIREWITEQDLWDSKDEITPKFVELLVAIVQNINALELLKGKFGRELPILIHELEYYEKIAQQNIKANGETLDRDFVSFGDDYADVGMLKMCGIGVVMGNAIQEVKDIADDITLSNEEDGVAAYLEKLII